MVFRVTSIKSSKRKRLLYGTHAPALLIPSFDSENLQPYFLRVVSVVLLALSKKVVVLQYVLSPERCV